MMSGIRALSGHVFARVPTANRRDDTVAGGSPDGSRDTVFPSTAFCPIC